MIFDALDALFDPKPQRNDGTPKWRLEFPVNGAVLLLVFVAWILLGIFVAVIDGELQ